MSTEFYKKGKRKKAEEFKSSSKSSLGGHTEEPAVRATKSPSFLWLFAQERFFVRLRRTQTTKDTFSTSC